MTFIDWVLGAAVAMGVAVGLAWFMVDWSRRADNVRTYSQKDAETIDSLRVTRDNPAALPMHDRSFDKPTSY